MFVEVVPVGRKECVMQPSQDLHLLPRVQDSWSFLYVEQCYIDQDHHAIAIHQGGKQGTKVPVPCATLTTLLLGPGA